MSLRLNNTYRQLTRKNLDGLIVSLPSNISYLTESISRDAYLLVTKKKNIYFTDSRYTAEAKKNLSKTIEIKKTNGSVFKIIAGACNDLGLRNIGFEERYLPFAEYKKIKEGLNNKARLVPVHGIIEGLRQIKEAGEIEKIRKATQITVAALQFIPDLIVPGRKEIEIVAELERFIRYQGSSNSAFDIIAASGPNSTFPHHLPTERKIQDNESVLVDIGAEYAGYKSDLTRVFFLGKINACAKRIYAIVLEAQNRAIKKIKPGVKINAVDSAARQYIRQKGYGGFFGHNLGHGIGLDTHEEPHLSGREEETLKPGMVFTVEPAIYLPNKFGIRIEDIVLVTHKGCEILSGSLHK